MRLVSQVALSPLTVFSVRLRRVLELLLRITSWEGENPRSPGHIPQPRSRGARGPDGEASPAARRHPATGRRRGPATADRPWRDDRHLVHQDVVFKKQAAIGVDNRGAVHQAVGDDAVTRLGDHAIHRRHRIGLGYVQLVEGEAIPRLESERVLVEKDPLAHALQTSFRPGLEVKALEGDQVGLLLLG